MIAKIRFKKFNQDWKKFVFDTGIHIIYGESGVGKSSLLDGIQGKKLKDSLNFEINISLDPALKVYRIFHNPDHQIIASTVSNEITFAGECKQLDPKQLKEILERNLKFLPDHIDPMMNPGYLSGGEKELLNLVTALDFDPDILLIDDGLSFLSEENKEYCLEMMKGWIERSGGIIIWVTSDIEDLRYGENSLTLSLDSLSACILSKKIRYEEAHLPLGTMSIIIDNLTFGYMGHREIYNNLSLNVHNVRSLGLLGNNGTGKTTFAGLCFGDLSPTSGKVDISISGKKDLNVGYLDQFPEHLILLKTTNELVTELKENQIFDNSLDRTFKKRLNRFGIQWDHIYNTKGVDLPWAVLRIFLLVLLCHCRFDVLILDEPTFGLGWDQRVKLRSFIRECMSHLHFMIVSHDKVFIRSICQQVIDLDELDNKHVRIREKETTKP
ncbi:MAG: ATP-binding cassette domain-containing protein [Candidatus Neomarinimicrobiota bacterium]